MSVVCGFQLPNAVVLATDSLLAVAHGGMVHAVSNEETKIHFWGNGLLAGVGLHAAITDAALRLASAQPGDTDDIEARLIGTWRSTVDPLRAGAPLEVASLLDATSVFVSIGFPDGPAAAVFAPAQFGPHLRVPPAGALFGAPPADLDPAEWRVVLKDRGAALVRTIENDVPVGIVLSLAALIGDVAKRSAHVSPTADVCVHRKAVDGGNRLWRVRGAAQDVATCVTLAELARFETPMDRVPGSERAL